MKSHHKTMHSENKTLLKSSSVYRTEKKKLEHKKNRFSTQSILKLSFSVSHISECCLRAYFFYSTYISGAMIVVVGLVSNKMRIGWCKSEKKIQWNILHWQQNCRKCNVKNVNRKKNNNNKKNNYKRWKEYLKKHIQQDESKEVAVE